MIYILASENLQSKVERHEQRHLALRTVENHCHAVLDTVNRLELQKKYSQKKAFTLLEVMVALGIIAISISSIMSSMAVGASIPYDSKKRLKAVDLSIIKLHEMERKLKKDGFKDEDIEEHGDFDDEDFKEYHWIARIKKIEIPDDIAMLTKMFLGGTSDGDSDAEKQKYSKEAGLMGLFGGFIQELKDTFEEAIREIEIEVFWYYGAEEEENREKFILTTHIIDFSKIKGINIPGRGR